MQLWVSKLNKNKWKIALILLSVAVVTSCVFGVTTAWFNTVDRAKANVTMDVQYVNIFVDQTGNGNEYEMVPGQSITITSPKVDVNESSGKFCVFVQVSELGGTAGHTYLEYTTANGWTKLTNAQAVAYKFPQKEDTSYYYQLVEDASTVSKLNVLQSTVTVNQDTTYAQIKKAWESDSPVKLQVVAAGCATTAVSGLPTAAEVDYADVYTAFIG